MRAQISLQQQLKMKMNQLRCLEKEFAKNTVFFNAINPDFNMEKVNYPENTWFYINQAYLTVKKKKKYFIATILSSDK